MIKKAFTLIEVLITIAIIALMATLLIPNINRSLSKNNIANDAQLLQAKLEQVRLLAGSTQQFDSGKGYYALYFPSDSNKDVYILRVDDTTDNPTATCKISSFTNSEVISQTYGDCVVEKIPLSNGVTHQTTSPVFVLFKVPTQQLFKAQYTPNVGIEIVDPQNIVYSSWIDFSDLSLNNGEKTATLSVNNVTGKLSFKFN
ncbi:type II secretion system protein [Candidatus Berkelbacteria bacterium]|nr:type II secretion system protein [Candidatus Berkelbacteria bacterium]